MTTTAELELLVKYTTAILASDYIIYCCFAHDVRETTK